MKKLIPILLFISLFFFSQVSAQMIKTGNSDHYPETILVSNDSYQCRYNIQTVEITDENGVRDAYNYNYLEAKELTEENVRSEIPENYSDTEAVIQTIMDEKTAIINGNSEEINIIVVKDKLLNY